jgi:hypothetical protein
VSGVDFGTGFCSFGGARIVEDRNLVDYVEDWSKVRSPSRARRRLKRGFAQNILMREVPRQTVYSFNNGRTLVMHPDVARELDRQMTREMNAQADRAFYNGAMR